MNWQPYVGCYYFMGFVLDVRQKDDQLVAAMPDVPAGYEIAMAHLGDDRFRLDGGPLDRATVDFVRDADEKVTAVQAGGFKLSKIDPKTLSSMDVVERLPAPSFELTPEKRAAFAHLLDSALQQRDGEWIEYNLPYPKHEFVQYVTREDVVIFHGSNNMEIDTFAPVRKSVELRDETGRGNLQAIYGTHDGLWAMFFAIVDRARLRGSIRNGVMYFNNSAGEMLAVYNFSINQQQLAEQPWAEGALYFLPRDTFERLFVFGDTYANEWASEQAVEPIVKLRLQPEDFPFLGRIGGHDDGELIRLQALREGIRAAARRAKLRDDRFVVAIPAEMKSDLDEFVDIMRTLMPSADFVVTPSADELTLEISPLSPAFCQQLKDEYADLLVV